MRRILIEPPVRPLAPLPNEGAVDVVLSGSCPFDGSLLVFCMHEGYPPWLACQQCGRVFGATPEDLAVKAVAFKLRLVE